MRSIRKSGVTALTAAIALSLGVIPAALTVPAIMAGGQATTTMTPASVSTGTQVQLTTTSAQGRVTGNGKTQIFTGGQQCEITPLDAVHLLDITGSVGVLPDGSTQTGTPGFRDGDIGVYESGASGSDPNNASQCFRVDSASFTETEALTVALGDDPSFTDVGGAILAEKATVDIYAKTQTGQVKVETLDASGTPITTATYVWPKTKLGNKITVVPALTTPGTAFDGVRLTAIAGSFSLRGATFDLVSQADFYFNCSDQTSFTKDGVTTTYTGNADASACSGFGVTLDRASGADGQTTTFHKPLVVDPDAQFVFEVPWDKKSATSPNTLPKAEIDFEIPNRAAVWHELGFCPDYLYVDGVIKGLFPPTVNGQPDKNNAEYKANYDLLKSLDMEKPADGQAEIPANAGIQFACIGARTPVFSKATSGFDVQVTDTLYLIGDAAFRN